MAADTICTIPNCGKPKEAKGFCSSHYARLRRHGDPLRGGKTRPPKGSLPAFIKDVIIPYGGNECLLWPFSRNSAGYATVKNDDGSTLVSRIVCEASHGKPRTAKMDAAHSCGNGHLGCVAKAHLSWKSRSANNMDKVTHGTHNRGERNPNAKLLQSEVTEILKSGDPEDYIGIALAHSVNPATIHSIFRRKSWAWLDVDQAVSDHPKSNSSPRIA